MTRYAPRSFNSGKAVKGETAISKHLPKPNVVRIEPLPYSVRKRYMGGFYSVTEQLKSAMMSRLSNGYLPFYGILDQSAASKLAISVNGMWSGSTMGSPFNAMMQLVKDGADVFSKNLGNKVKKVTKFVNKTTGTLTEVMGLNTTATGSSTIKKVGNPKMTVTVPLNFTYYMPEQSEMCRIGIKRLLQLAYLRPANTSKENIQKICAEGANKLVNESLVNTINDATAAGLGNDLKGAVSWMAEKLASLSSVFVNDVGKDFFGMSITVNPVPVRITVGHYFDLQPMVLDEVKISASKEQFVSSDGSHIPLFVTATVRASYWLNPDPSSEFLSFLGDEIFKG